MADEPQNPQSSTSTPLPDSKAPMPMFWLAFAALFGMLLLSIVALMMVSKNSSAPQITITNASNNKEERPPAPLPAAPPAPAAPAWRPDRSVDPDAHRMSGQMAGAPQTLPGALASPTAVSGKREGAAQAVRADTQSPPYYSTLSPAVKVQFRVRGMPGGPAGLNGPVPFRVHAWQAMPDGRVASVEASVPATGVEDKDLYSYLPEIAYKPSAGKGPIMSITVSNPRKTSVVNGLRAPKGFQFLVAEIAAKNVGKNWITIEPDMFEIQDSDRVPYLPNPELLSADFPQAAIAPKKSGKFTAAFLVPADASLVALVAREPGDGLISSPLNPK